MSFRAFGTFLVEEGYVSRQELERALWRQIQLRQLPLTEVLVQRRAVSRRDLEGYYQRFVQEAFNSDGPRKRRYFGEYLVEEGVIERDDLDRALYALRRNRRKPIGEVLVDLGYLTRRDLERAVRAQLVELAVE